MNATNRSSLFYYNHNKIQNKSFNNLIPPVFLFDQVDINYQVVLTLFILWSYFKRALGYSTERTKICYYQKKHAKVL